MSLTIISDLPGGGNDHLGVISSVAAIERLPAHFQSRAATSMIARHSNSFAQRLRTRTKAPHVRARMQAAQ